MLFVQASSFGFPEVHMPCCPHNSIPPYVPCAARNAFQFVARLPGMHPNTSSKVIPMGSETFLVRAMIRLNPESRLHKTFRDLSVPVPSL